MTRHTTKILAFWLPLTLAAALTAGCGGTPATTKPSITSTNPEERKGAVKSIRDKYVAPSSATEKKGE
jgi:hypothetical protein